MVRHNEDWIAALNAGQESALIELRDALVRNLASALAPDNKDLTFLEDVAQDSMVRILDHLHQFEGRSRFLTWATSIAIRIALAERRRSRWKDVSLDRLVDQADFLPDVAVDPTADPQAHLERRAAVESMFEVMERELTDRQRSALLAEIKGMPQDEIARQLNSNRNALYKLTHDARVKLRKGMEAAGYTAEDVLSTTT